MLSSSHTTSPAAPAPSQHQRFSQAAAGVTQGCRAEQMVSETQAQNHFSAGEVQPSLVLPLCYPQLIAEVVCVVCYALSSYGP